MSANFSPRKGTHADEPIVRWCGHGVDWMNYGIPHCITIDLKRENGLETQHSDCGDSIVIIMLKLVKGSMDEDKVDDSTAHGPKVFVNKPDSNVTIE